MDSKTDQAKRTRILVVLDLHKVKSGVANDLQEHMCKRWNCDAIFLRVPNPTQPVSLFSIDNLPSADLEELSKLVKQAEIEEVE